MVTRYSDLNTLVKSQMMGGHGDVHIRQFLKEEDACGMGRMFAEFTIKPGDGIGYHTHHGEFENFYILEGTAKLTQNDEVFTLNAGDAALCKDGDSHSIENCGDKDLKLIAVILFTEKKEK